MNTMKKIYIAPDVLSVEMSCGGLLAVSGGLNDGDSVGNRKPTGDGDDNFYSNRRGNWDDNDDWE